MLACLPQPGWIFTLQWLQLSPAGAASFDSCFKQASVKSLAVAACTKGNRMIGHTGAVEGTAALDWGKGRGQEGCAGSVWRGPVAEELAGRLCFSFHCGSGLATRLGGLQSCWPLADGPRPCRSAAALPLPLPLLLLLPFPPTCDSATRCFCPRPGPGPQLHLHLCPCPISHAIPPPILPPSPSLPPSPASPQLQGQN